MLTTILLAAAVVSAPANHPREFTKKELTTAEMFCTATLREQRLYVGPIHTRPAQGFRAFYVCWNVYLEAMKQDVDPTMMVALAINESDLRDIPGQHTEIGPIQVKPKHHCSPRSAYAKKFGVSECVEPMAIPNGVASIYALRNTQEPSKCESGPHKGKLRCYTKYARKRQKRGLKRFWSLVLCHYNAGTVCDQGGYASRVLTIHTRLTRRHKRFIRRLSKATLASRG